MAMVASGHFRDGFNRVHAACGFTEHTVAPTVRRFRFEVLELIVREVDKELRACAVWIRGARHRDAANVIT